MMHLGELLRPLLIKNTRTSGGQPAASRPSMAGDNDFEINDERLALVRPCKRSTIGPRHLLFTGIGVKWPFLSYRASKNLGQYSLARRTQLTCLKNVLKKVYDRVISLIFVMVGSLTKSGSIKKNTGMSTVSPALSLCSSKQKH